MSKSKEIPESALLALRANTGMVCRHGPNGEIDQLCMAARLGDGLWATVHDRGVYGDRVHGKNRGTLEVIDLHMHVDTDGGRVVLPVRWAVHAALEPIAFLAVPGDRGTTPEFVGAAEMMVPSYRKIYVPAPSLKEGDRFFGPHKASDIDMEIPFDANPGSVFGPPRLQTYRCGSSDAHRVGSPLDDVWSKTYDQASRRTTTCVQGDMNYTRDGVLGAPVSDADGRIAGVLIGAGQGGGSDHIGAYVPIDLILPLAAVAKALNDLSADRGCYSSLVDHVDHESTEVNFG